MRNPAWLILSTVALLVACSAPAPAPSAPEQDVLTPKPGGLVRLPIANDFYDFDPSYNGSGSPNFSATMLANENLLGFKVGPDVPYGELILVPRVAEKWEVSSDAKAFTFHLRKGVKFANLPPVDGRELSSADVKFTFEYLGREGAFKDKGLPPSQYAFPFEGLDRIDTPDASTVVVRFKKPFVPFITYVPTFVSIILPKEIYEKDGHFKNRMAGAGPFQLDSAASQSGTRWTFKKNPSYWQAGKPFLDELQYLVIKDNATKNAAFLAKQIDALDVDTAVYNGLKAQLGDAVVTSFKSPRPVGMFMSQRHPPMNDERVRRAITLAIDQEEFDRLTSGGLGGRVVSGVWVDTFSQDEIKQMIKFDPEQAKRLLREAGFPDGVEIRISSGVARNTGAPSSQELLLQAQLKRVGFNAVMETPDTATWRTKLYSGDFHLMPLGENWLGDPDAYFSNNFFSTSSGNWPWVKDTKLDQLIEAQRSEPDVAKRKEILRQIARYINEHAYHGALYRDITYTLAQPYLKGYSPHWLVEGIDAHNIWLNK